MCYAGNDNKTERLQCRVETQITENEEMNLFSTSIYSEMNLMLVNITSNLLYCPQLQVHWHSQSLLKNTFEVQCDFETCTVLVSLSVQSTCHKCQHASSLDRSIETLLCNISFLSVLMILSVCLCLSSFGCVWCFLSTKGQLLNESLWWWLCKFNLFLYVSMRPLYFTSIYFPTYLLITFVRLLLLHLRIHFLILPHAFCLLCRSFTTQTFINPHQFRSSGVV